MSEEKTVAEQLAEDEAKRRRNSLTRALPGKWRSTIRRYLNAGYTPEEILEESAAILHAVRDHRIAVYQEDLDRMARQRERADEIRASVADLPTDDPDRARAERRADIMDAVHPDHDRAAMVIADITDRLRKVTDSLHDHRPSGHARVRIDVIGVPAGDGENYIRLASPYDSELMTSTADE